MDSKMVQVSKAKQMDLFIMANGKTVKSTDKENALFLQPKNMREITQMVLSMDSVIKHSKMVTLMQETTLKENSMDQVCMFVFRRLYMGKSFKI